MAVRRCPNGLPSEKMKVAMSGTKKYSAAMTKMTHQAKRVRLIAAISLPGAGAIGRPGS